MNLLKPLGRWTMRSLKILTLTAGITATGAVAMAQSTPARPQSQAAMPKRIYAKTAEFKLPIQMDDKTRAGLDRVCLYVKTGSADWVRQETGPATMPYFIYRVPQDGEYWFSLTTVDKSGRMSPADVSQEPPSLRVIVDTKAPTLDVQLWTGSQNEVGLRCNIIDANPDPQSLKVTAKLPGGDRLLTAQSSQSGVFLAAGPDMLTASIEVSARDLSGNSTTREVRLRDLMTSPVHATQLQATQLQAPQQQAPLPPPLIENAKADLPPLPKIELPTTAKTELPAPSQLPMALIPDSLPVQPPSLPPAPLPMNNQVVTTTSNLRPELEAPSRLPTAPPAKSAPTNKQIINTSRAVLDYRIDQVGPSGVGKVDVYLTTDQGQSWQKIAEDTDRRSPVEFDLPGEGLFGVRLAITNGNGFGGTAPQRGDAALCWIEVDTSAPFVQLRPIDPVVAGGALEIRWQSTDKNLGAEPVNLYYRSRTDGPWQVMARGLKNDGLYRWTFPRDATAQFFVKVEVTDLAGNVARAETPNAVVLDMTEPHATVVGVSGLSVRPGGN